MRNITALTSASSNPVKFTSAATTTKELIVDFQANGIPTSNIEIKDRNTRVVYNPESLLPDHDLTLFVVPVNIKSGGKKLKVTMIKTKTLTSIIAKLDSLNAKVSKVEEVAKNVVSDETLKAEYKEITGNK